MHDQPLVRRYPPPEVHPVVRLVGRQTSADMRSARKHVRRREHDGLAAHAGVGAEGERGERRVEGVGGEEVEFGEVVRCAGLGHGLGAC